MVRMDKLGMQVLQEILICHWKWKSLTGYSGFRWYSTEFLIFKVPEGFYCLHNSLSLDVLSTVHHSIELFHQPTLMHSFLYSLTICLLMNKEHCALKLVDEIILSLSLVSMLSHMNPVHVFSCNLFRNILILSSPLSQGQPCGTFHLELCCVTITKSYT